MSVPKNKRTENKLQALKETLDVETAVKPSEVYIKYKGV